MILKIGLYILVTIIFTIILAVTQEKTGLSFERISLPQLAPAIAVLIFFLIYKDVPARINIHFDKLILSKSLIALFFPLFLFGISFFVGKLFGLNLQITGNLSRLFPIIILGMLIGAFGEEIGWRSFLQPILEKKNAVLLASIIVGIIWGLWHIGHYKNGLLFMIGFLLFTISASIIVAYLFQNTEYNLIVSAIFHLSINIGFFIFFNNSMADSKFTLVNGIIWLIPTIGIVLMNGKELIRI